MLHELKYFYPDVATLYSAIVEDRLEAMEQIIDPFLPSDVNPQDFYNFVLASIFYYYYNDLIAYENEGDFENRIAYDISIRVPYWWRKYEYIQKLTKELDLMQSSKMTSSSKDRTSSAGGSSQKTASTPTGVTFNADESDINVTLDDISAEDRNYIETNVQTSDFIQKYTNYQGKTQTATTAKGERESDISRQGSIDDLLKVLEKLPSSFANEITKAVSKHFIFDYEGEKIYG